MDFDPLLSMSLALEEEPSVQGFGISTVGPTGGTSSFVEPLPINNQKGYVNIVGRITALPADILGSPDDYLLALSQPSPSQMVKPSMMGMNGMTMGNTTMPMNQLMESTFRRTPSMNSSERSGGSNNSFDRAAQQQQQHQQLQQQSRMVPGFFPHQQVRPNMGFQ